MCNVDVVIFKKKKGKQNFYSKFQLYWICAVWMLFRNEVRVRGFLNIMKQVVYLYSFIKRNIKIGW